MIIKKIKALEFGRLSSYESPELSKNINVFYGRNEAGKSTIFNIIMTLIYGFSPASRENNPYTSWERDEAACEGEFELSEGSNIIVSRTLKSRVDGRVTNASKIQAINNNPLEFTGNISREIFQEVFAITQDKLGIPDEKLYQKLQEQLLGGQYASFIRPVSLVCSEIDSEASGLWKDDNRGKPRDKELSFKIKELNTRLVKAREDEKKIYNAIEELEKLDREIEGLRQKRYEYVTCLDRIERVAPAARKLKAIDSMKAEAGNIEVFKDIPEKPLDFFESIEEKIIDFNLKQAKLEKQLEDLQMTIQGYEPVYGKVCGIREKISSTIKTQGLIISGMEIIKNLQREKDSTTSRLSSDCDRLLAGGFKKELAVKIKSIDNVELKESIDNFKAVERKINEQEIKNAALDIKIKSSRKSMAIPAAAIAAFSLGLTSLITLRASEFKITGGIFAALGFMLFVYYILTGSNKSSEIELKEGEKLLKKYLNLRDEASGRVKSALRDIPFGDMRLSSPDETLLINVREIRDNIIKIDSLELQLKKENDELNSWNNNISCIFEELGLRSSGSVISDLDKLELLLDESLNKKREYEAALTETKKIDVDILNHKKEVETLEDKKGEILKLAYKLEGETLQEKIGDLEKRRRLMFKAVALEEEFEDDPQGYTFIKSEIAAAIDRGDSWLYNDDDAVRMKLDNQEIDRQLEDRIEKAGSLRSTIKQLKDLNSLDDITGEIACCEAERKEIEFKRDRLIVLRNIIMQADRRFKDEHQPDVLHRAGKYLSIVTSGKYDKIYSADDNSPGLMIRSAADGNVIPAMHPLSRGTLEQIYFCLRIALLDHLDSFSEKLPLFMDETFINWDGVRIGEGIDLIKQISQNRQVIIFTCHNWFADILECKSGCLRIDMV